MDYVLLGLTVFMASVKAVLNRKLKGSATTVFATLKTNLFCFCFSFLVMFLFAVKDLRMIGNTPFLLSFCLAVCTLGSQICLMKAMQLGSVAVSALFAYCGFIIPTVWGTIEYKEEFKIAQALGILMILIAFVLSTKKEKDAQFNFAWLLFSLGGLIFSGLVGIIQKIFAYEYVGASLNNFLTVAFATLLVVGALCLFFVYLFEKKQGAKNERGNERVSSAERWKSVAFIAGVGILIAVINIVNTYLSGRLPSAVVFPVINGGSIFVTTIMSVLIFKEKPTKSQTTGLAVGVLAILVIALM